MGLISLVHNTRTFLFISGVHCLNTGEVYQPLAAFSSTFYTGTVHIYWQFIFEIIWFLLISDELIIIICLTWSWWWCDADSCRRPLAFILLLSGSRAHRDTCVPPITELWKFSVFKHCSFHSLSLSYLLLLSPSCVSPQLLLLSLNMNSLFAFIPTQPCAPNFCVQYI